MPKATKTSILPVHSLDDRNVPIKLEDISYPNPYDFSQKHRHSYFEIIFFKRGGGIQLIDFEEYEVKDHSCYIIFPKQIHLLKRADTSRGRVLQFREESIAESNLHMLLHQRLWAGKKRCHI